MRAGPCLLFLLMLLPFVPGASFSAAYAQTGGDLGSSFNMIAAWLASLLTTLGTPAAVVGSIVGGTYYSWKLLVAVVIKGRPIDLHVRIDDRVLSIQLVKVKADEPLASPPEA